MRAMARPAYRRTERGRKAWDTQNPAVSLEYRRVLGHITGEIDCDSLRARVGRYSETELLELLAELESLGLVESRAQEAAQDDLDFTGSFNLADLQRGQKKQ